MAESDPAKAESADATRASLLIADNEAATRELVALALRDHADVRVGAEVSDAAAAVEAALREQPDVCLLDIRIPGDGIAATREITSRLRSTKTVIFSRSSEEGELFAALHAGACGFLPKETNPTRLPAILRDVVSGTGAALPRRLVLRLVEEFNMETVPLRRQQITDLRTQLTGREWQVLQLLRRGLSTREVARQLFISEATVRSHSATLVRKLGVRDRKAAIRLFDN
jgi:two-component system nitrate/nitrite response regulator NarL